MGQSNLPIGTQVGPSRQPPPTQGAPALPPPQQGLGALSRQVQQDKTAQLLGLLMAKQYPQMMGTAPTIPSFDMANAEVQDPLQQTLMQRIR